MTCIIMILDHFALLHICDNYCPVRVKQIPQHTEYVQYNSCGQLPVGGGVYKLQQIILLSGNQWNTLADIQYNIIRATTY